MSNSKQNEFIELRNYIERVRNSVAAEADAADKALDLLQRSADLLGAGLGNTVTPGNEGCEHELTRRVNIVRSDVDRVRVKMHGLMYAVKGVPLAAVEARDTHAPWDNAMRKLAQLEHGDPEFDREIAKMDEGV